LQKGRDLANRATAQEIGRVGGRYPDTSLFQSTPRLKSVVTAETDGSDTPQLAASKMIALLKEIPQLAAAKFTQKKRITGASNDESRIS
jgi:hypothetical protein